MRNRPPLHISFLLFIIIFSGCSIEGVYIAESHRSMPPFVSGDSILTSLFLIGDAGEPSAARIEPTFRVLIEQASVRPHSSTIVFLGDNIYPRGLPEADSPERPEMERRFREQIAIAEKSGACAVFVPGNHDWEYQGKNGWEALKREEDLLRSIRNPNIVMLPSGGSPGPVAVDVSDSLRLIAMDTQWRLHRFEKPFYPGDTSESQTRRRFLDSLTALIRSAGNRNVVIAAHHPLQTHGEHGGFFDWKDHLFPLRKMVPWLWLPLPGIGSLYPLSRMMGISDQDMPGSGNIEMRKDLDSLLTVNPVLVYAAGHEHTLQILTGKEPHLNVVSGKGIAKHSEALTVKGNTIAATRHPGFQRIDLLRDGGIRLSMIDCSNGEGVEVFTMKLK